MADLSEFLLTARGHLSPILSRSGNILTAAPQLSGRGRSTSWASTPGGSERRPASGTDHRVRAGRPTR